MNNSTIVIFHYYFLAVSRSSFKAVLSMKEESIQTKDKKHFLILYNYGSFFVVVLVECVHEKKEEMKGTSIPTRHATKEKVTMVDLFSTHENVHEVHRG